VVIAQRRHYKWWRIFRVSAAGGGIGGGIGINAEKSKTKKRAIAHKHGGIGGVAHRAYTSAAAIMAWQRRAVLLYDLLYDIIDPVVPVLCSRML